MRRLIMLIALSSLAAGCGGLELGGVTEDASATEVEFVTEEEADAAAEEEIDASNLEDELDALLEDLEEEEADL